MTDRRSPQTQAEAVRQVIDDLIGFDLSAASKREGERKAALAAEPKAEGIDPDRLARLVAAARETDRLKAELATANKQFAALKDELLEQFLEAGVKQYKTNDATIFIKKSEFVSLRRQPGEETADAEERVAAQLEAIGMGWLAKHVTKVDLSSVKSTMKELAENPEDGSDSLEALSELISTAEVYELAVRRN